MTSDNRSLWRSFAGGEITPELFGRMDLAKYQTGLQLCRNFITRAHGPAVNRAGFAYVLNAKYGNKKSRVYPFQDSAGNPYMLEFGDQYVRFHAYGGTLVEASKLISGLTQGTQALITINAHGYSNGDWVYVGDLLTGPTRLNARFVVVSDATANNFKIKDLWGQYVSTAGQSAWVAGGSVSRLYELTTPYLEADLFNLHLAQSDAVLTITHPSYAVRELTYTGPVSWAFGTPSFGTPLTAPTGLSATPSTAGGDTQDYVVTALNANGEESVASANTTCTCQLYTAGRYVTVSWSAVSGATRYSIYKLRGGIYAYIGQSTTTSFKDDNIVADPSLSPPTTTNPFGSASNYPAAVSYVEQRRAFAGTANKPSTTWLTRTGTDSNMCSSTPTRADDAISFRIAALKVNNIRHIVSLDEMILLTPSAVWRVFGKNSDALTPSSISAKPVSYDGASNTQPVVTATSVLYGADSGGHLMEAKYSWEQNGIATSDLSLMAPHLVDGYTLTDMTFRYSPDRSWFGVRSDGTLLGLTYVPKQEVLGWHQHTTAGSFESVASVLENGEDAVYVVVKRTINSQTVRYIERLSSRRFATQADSFFVDAGLSYSGTPTNTVQVGLWHLEGATVSILADGAVLPAGTVTAGVLNVSAPFSKFQIGLGYNADLQTLPLGLEAQAAGVGTERNVAAVHMRVKESSGVKAGPTFTELQTLEQRTDEPYGTPPELITGVFKLPIEPSWNQDGAVCIRQADPLPITVVALALEVGLGD
jgi:hypothetical protein